MTNFPLAFSSGWKNGFSRLFWSVTQKQFPVVVSWVRGYNNINNIISTGVLYIICLCVLVCLPLHAAHAHELRVGAKHSAQLLLQYVPLLYLDGNVRFKTQALRGHAVLDAFPLHPWWGERRLSLSRKSLARRRHRARSAIESRHAQTS